MEQRRTVSRSDCETKEGFDRTIGDNQLSGWTEKKLQSTSPVKLAPEKVHGRCLMVCRPSDPGELPESRQNNYIGEVCSPDGGDARETAMPADSTGQQKGLNSSPQ